MLILILLIIVAIMLVGSSAVLGAIGLIAGCLVFSVALVAAAAVTGIPGSYLFFGFLGFIALVGLMFKVDEKIFEPRRVEKILAKELELESMPEMSVYRNRKTLSPASLIEARESLIRKGVARDSIYIKALDQEIVAAKNDIKPRSART